MEDLLCRAPGSCTGPSGNQLLCSVSCRLFPDHNVHDVMEISVYIDLIEPGYHIVRIWTNLGCI